MSSLPHLSAPSMPNMPSIDGGTVRTVLTTVVLPITTAAAGVAGGIVLARTKLRRKRKVLGVPLPGTHVDLADLTKQLGDAGRQFGHLAGEVRAAREKAEEIGRAIGG
jgi:hypothetical protein